MSFFCLLFVFVFCFVCICFSCVWVLVWVCVCVCRGGCERVFLFCFWLFTFLFVCLFVCLFTCLSVWLFVCFLFLFVCFRNHLAAHWWGFHDPQSALSHYEWRAGTLKGASDILKSTRLHLTESSFTVLDRDLPVETMIYITVRAYNRVGLWSERSSDGFKIDDSAPEIIQPPMIDSTKGVILNGTQVNVLCKNSCYC